MKIGIVCYPVIGGSGAVATDLGTQLSRRGHEVHFFSYALPFRLDPDCETLFYHQVETSSYPLFKYPPYTLTLAAKIAEIASQENLDIVHAHYAIPHAICGYLAKQMLGGKSPKLITTLHGTDVTLVGAEQSFKGITRFSILASDAITAVSSYLKKEICHVFDLCEDIHVIYNFIDPEKYLPADPLNLKTKYAPEGEKVIMHMSNFRPLKRINDVMTVFAKVNRKIKSKLVLIGEGPEIHTATQLVKKYDLAGDVFFMGSKQNVERILAAADLFLLPSEHESFGLAAMEALCCGVPAIGTSNTGLPELIEDGKSGYICEKGDTDAMANKALELLTDTNKWQTFSKYARQSIVDKFHYEKIVGQYEKLYEQVLES